MLAPPQASSRRPELRSLALCGALALSLQAQEETTQRELVAELIQRIEQDDRATAAAHQLLICERCGGTRKLLTFLTEPRTVRRILEHLGLPSEPPTIAAARPPPDPVLPYA